ncbi:MAG: RNA polymerase sigma-70 factor [Bacteroidales bacterium]|nr:RNA polymerase sigma-70 factor [Bacteroidales bacterium]
MTLSKETIEHLFREYYASLLSYAKLMLPEEEAEDVVQDIFSWMLDHRLRLPMVSSEAEMRQYLLKSVWHGCLNRLRREKSDREHRLWYQERIDRQYAEYDPDNDPIIRRLYAEDVHGLVSSLLETLPQRCREIFTLSKIEGLPASKISGILGLSVSTVENHIYNAMKQLRSRLQK